MIYVLLTHNIIMRFPRIIFVCYLVVFTVHAFLTNIDKLPTAEFHVPGDINLGGIFTLSQFSSNSPCSDELLGTVQMQFAEAMAYAVDQVNADHDFLPGVKLGYTILDDCSKDTTALARALSFLPHCRFRPTCPSTNTSTNSDQCFRFHDAVAVVGAMSSKNSIAAADLLNQFNIPQVSAVSTSDILSDKTRYRYFLRMVSPDRDQVRTTVDFMAYFNWTYISVIVSKGSYGSHGLKLIKDRTRAKGICIAYSIEIMDGMTPVEFDAIVQNLLDKKDKAKVVVMYADVTAAEGVFKAAQRANAQGTFTWIISDAFSSPDSHKGIEDIVNQSFIVKMYAARVPEFDAYFTSLTPQNNRRNPWFKKFWSKHFGCSLHGNETGMPLCNSDLRISAENGYRQDDRVSLFMDTVYTIAYSLHFLIHEKCPNNRADKTRLRSCITGPDLLHYLLHTTFHGHIGEVRFDENGDMYGKYVVSQILYDVGNGTRMSPVAVWRDTDGIQVNTESIRWNDSDTGPPVSVCSKPCEAGSVPVKEELVCCWSCRKCRVNEIMTPDLSDCEECPVNTWPNQSTYINCHKIKPEYLRWHYPISMALLIVACLGGLSCSVVLTIFLKNKTMKIIKASSLEVSVIILIGIFLAYGTVVALVLPPSTASCTLSFLGFGLSFTVLYAPLLIKTIRIYRIFRSGQCGNTRPQFIASNWQVFFSISLIFVQVAVSVIMLLTIPPVPLEEMPIPTHEYVERHCYLPRGTILIPLSYNFILIVVCVVYAFKTRKLPDNFNESKYIFVCVCATLFLWLAFLPTYFATFYAKHKSIFLSVALIMNGAVFLLCLFGTRVYAVFYLDETKIKFTTISMRMTRHGSQANDLDRVQAHMKCSLDSETENDRGET